jgi:hypothetical protein
MEAEQKAINVHHQRVALRSSPAHLAQAQPVVQVDAQTSCAPLN